MSQTGTVYKISTDKSDKVYIGSTTQPLNKRFSQHKSDFKANAKKCCVSKELLELGECKIEALEVLYNCTKRELEIKEQFYLDLLKEKSVNKKRAYVLNKKYYTKKNYERKSEEHKKEQNREKGLRFYHKQMQDPEFRKKKAEEAKNRRLLKKSNLEAN
jgi:hypothetical protein